MSQNHDPKKNPNDEPRTGHEYDGIEELDYPVPNWFNGIFLGTVIFAAAYFVWYQVGDGTSIEKEYSTAAAQVEAVKAAEAQKGDSGPSDTDLIALAKDAVRTKQGLDLFQARCVACHGGGGAGGIGPNLTDTHWLHGGKPTQVLAVIKKGVLDKGMPPWESTMSADEVASVVAYIRTIAGTNPPGAKAPQGEPYKE